MCAPFASMLSQQNMPSHLHLAPRNPSQESTPTLTNCNWNNKGEIIASNSASLIPWHRIPTLEAENPECEFCMNGVFKENIFCLCTSVCIKINVNCLQRLPKSGEQQQDISKTQILTYIRKFSDILAIIMETQTDILIFFFKHTATKKPNSTLWKKISLELHSDVKSGAKPR